MKDGDKERTLLSSSPITAVLLKAIESETIKRQGEGITLVTGANDSLAFAKASIKALESEGYVITHPDRTKMRRPLNPPHVMLARALALPFLLLGRVGEWLWGLFE